jgi:uncharacterized protein (TIGR00369 family)
MSDDATTTRSRLVEWEDPAIGARRALSMRGLDFLRAMIAGEVSAPPIVVLMDMTLVRADEGDVEFACEPGESHYNPIGAVHGGFACTVLDSAAGCAVQSTLPAGLGYTSLDLTVSYVRAITAASGTLTAVGRVVKPGKRVAFAEAELRDADGRIVATASSTLLVFPVSDPAAGGPGVG